MLEGQPPALKAKRPRKYENVVHDQNDDVWFFHHFDTPGVVDIGRFQKPFGMLSWNLGEEDIGARRKRRHAVVKP